MRNFKIFVVGFLLVFPVLAMADARDVPGEASWYFYVDLEQMRSDGPGKAVYDWLREEALEDVKEDSGLDIERELDRVISYAVGDKEGVLVLEGDFSQNTRDIAMAFVASGATLFRCSPPARLTINLPATVKCPTRLRMTPATLRSASIRLRRSHTCRWM